jgi:hypothetical protein
VQVLARVASSPAFDCCYAAFQTLITALGQARDVSFWLNAALFVQGKAMLCPTAVRRTDDLFGALIDYHLAFGTGSV